MHTLHHYILKIPYPFLLLIILIKPSASFSQVYDSTGFIKDTITNYVEIIGFGSTADRTPFWMQANQYGIVPKKPSSASLRAGLEKIWGLDTNNMWRFGMGIEAAGNITDKGSKLLLPQVYATLRFKNWELYAGRKKMNVGLADSTIGTGSYAWSGNALPIPRISIGTRGFVNVPFTKGWLSFNGFYSDGFFENSRPLTSKLKLHQKMLYLRLGKASSKFRLYGGINHEVQWGGKSPYLTKESNELPNGLKNYFNMVRGAIGGVGDNISFFDSTSRIGNHLGTVDIAFELETYSTNWFIYRQFIYEDGSLFYLQALKDGLNGVRVRRKQSYGASFEVTEGVLEFLYTKDQGGDDFIIGDPKKRGRDNYFNNQQVRDGWSYFGRTIGTPFIPPSSNTNWKYPNYADNHTSNNRVLVVHLGLKGTLVQRIQWYTKFSYSHNSGAYLAPIRPAAEQFSGLIALQSRLNVFGGTTIKGSFAADIGDLYPKSYGFSLGLRKDFSL